MIDYPLLVMLLLVFWLRWRTYRYVVIYIAQRLCSHSEKQSITPHSTVRSRRQLLSQAPWKENGPPTPILLPARISFPRKSPLRTRESLLQRTQIFFHL